MSIKETVAIEITSDTGKAVASVNELKEALKKTNQQTEELRNQRIDDAARTVTALSAAYGGLQGALELTGLAGEDTMKQLAKIQSALAIGDAIQNMVEFRGAIVNTFTMLTKLPVIMHVIKAAQWLWNAAMNANPIGALVTAITALIAGITMLIKYFKDSADAAEQQTKSVKQASKAIEQQKKAIDEANESMDRRQKHELNMLKASGASAEAIRKKEKALIDEKIATAEATAQTALNTVEQEKNRLAYLKSVDADDEVIKAQEDNLKKAREILKSANEDVKKADNERLDLNNRHQEEIKKAETDANAESLKKQKERNDKRLEDQKKANEELLQANKTLHEQTKKQNDENFINSIKDENARAEAKLQLDYTNKIREINSSKANAEEKAAALLANEQKFGIDLQNLKDKIAEDQKKKDEEKRKKDIENQIKAEKETFDLVTQARLSQIADTGVKRQEEEALRYQGEIDNLYNALNNKEITEADFNARREALKTLHEGKLTEIEKQNADDRKKTAEAEYQAKIKLWNDTGNAVGELADVIGKTTGVGKALGLAQIAIDTGVAISSLTRNSENNPLNAPTGGIAGAIQFATGLIRILANIKKAKEILSSAKVPGGGGGGGGGTMPSISATAPVAPQMSNTALNQQMINQQGNAATRAFVLESDVSGNQERIRRLNRAARIN